MSFLEGFETWVLRTEFNSILSSGFLMVLNERMSNTEQWNVSKKVVCKSIDLDGMMDGRDFCQVLTRLLHQAGGRVL